MECTCQESRNTVYRYVGYYFFERNTSKYVLAIQKKIESDKQFPISIVFVAWDFLEEKERESRGRKRERERVIKEREKEKERKRKKGLIVLGVFSFIEISFASV